MWSTLGFVCYLSVVVFTVPSIYFWRLKHVTPQGFLEGNPAFRAHGTVQASDGGVAFDGQTGFLTTDMSANDCVMNPALCPKGLSVGMNLKFDQSVKTYKEPRYLIDTGAQSSQTRGISIYVKDGKVFFTLAISQKVWEVSMKKLKVLISTHCIDLHRNLSRTNYWDTSILDNIFYPITPPPPPNNVGFAIFTVRLPKPRPPKQ